MLLTLQKFPFLAWCVCGFKSFCGLLQVDTQWTDVISALLPLYLDIYI